MSYSREDTASELVSDTGACCGLSPQCACTWWVQAPDVPAVAAIDVPASACGDHVACFSLEHEGILDCWSRSGDQTA